MIDSMDRVRRRKGQSGCAGHCGEIRAARAARKWVMRRPFGDRVQPTADTVCPCLSAAILPLRNCARPWLSGPLDTFGYRSIHQGALLDPPILERLREQAFLAEQIARLQALGNARLLSAVPRAIDARGYLCDLTGVVLDWGGAAASARRAPC